MRRYSTQPMETMYVSMRETRLREMMALNATLDPILIRLSRMVIRQVTPTALAGTCSVGWTYAIHDENGRPLSRAKAHVWREVDRLNDTVPAKMRTSTMIVSALT